MRSMFLAALLATFGAACSHETPAAARPSTGPESETDAPQLTVYAATSTRDALQSLAEGFERDRGVHVVFNFGSSGDLSKQIVAAAKADVFVSADEKEMDRVEQAGLLLAGSRRALLSNQLVVVEPAGGPSAFTAPFAPEQLAGDAVRRLSLGNVETVPAGRYAKAWLEKVGVWPSVSERVLPGVDARAALAAVESAGAQAGVVYATDAALSEKVRVVHAVAIAEGPKISYPMAVIAGRPREADARAWADLLTSPAARAEFEEHGFVFLPALETAK